MNFSQEDARKLAKLARIGMNEAELERMRETLGSVLEYVEKIALADVSEVDDTESSLEPFVRTDEIMNCDEQTISRIVSQFPDRENDALVVPAVFENPKG